MSDGFNVYHGEFILFLIISFDFWDEELLIDFDLFTLVFSSLVVIDVFIDTLSMSTMIHCLFYASKCQEPGDKLHCSVIHDLHRSVNKFF